jgi:polyribonucleotide nucleotidyltransferase
MNKEIKYGLKVKGEIFEVKDMMDECPFEGSELAYLADISPSEDYEGEFDISIISDNEGYTYSTADFEEYEIKDVKVVEL